METIIDTLAAREGYRLETVIDTAAALEQLDGDRDLFRELAQMVLEHIPELMAEVRDACAGTDAGALEMAAHKLKGSAGTLAAAGLWNSAERLEVLGRDGNRAGSEVLLADLEVEAKRLVEALRGLA
jgi:HPt (histidine-containing phosphotransfer) domain-containing protein